MRIEPGGYNVTAHPEPEGEPDRDTEFMQVQQMTSVGEKHICEYKNATISTA
jgi:hypothetical protein